MQVFYAGDDAGAKDIVRRLAESIGFEPVDGGLLATWSRSACSTSGSATWAGRGTNIAPRWDTAASVIPVAL